jgi:putative flippase GtrA
MILVKHALVEGSFLRFLVVGVCNTLFGYAIFAGLIFFHIHYAIAMFFSTIVGIVFNFFTTGRMVFKNKKNSLFFKFIFIYGVVYLLNILFVAELNNFLHDLYFNGAISLIMLSFISFFANKYYVFKECA